MRALRPTLRCISVADGKVAWEAPERIQGLCPGLRMIDKNQADDKIIAVLKGDPVYGNWKDFSPRLGFALKATNGVKPLVIRGGYSR